MNEQIEKHELSDSIYMSGHGLDRKDSDDIAEQLYTEGYRKQSEIADDIIAIIEQRMARNIERLNSCQSDVWKVGYLAENEAYQDIIEIIEQRMKGGTE